MTMQMQQLYLHGKRQLAQAGVESPACDAGCLFERFVGLDRSGILMHAQDPCPPDAARRFCDAIAQRADGVPLQYLLGEWPFLGRSFSVGEGVLIPREETELLVEEAHSFAASAFAADHPFHLLDLCAGSGAIAISCACDHPEAQVTALELSDGAFPFLEQNNRRYGSRVTLLHGDVLDPACAAAVLPQDVIVSNPPYIPAGDLPGLQREVQHEPAMALDGGQDGLLFYRAILTHWLPRLRPGGLLAVECGMGQAQVLAQMFSEKRLKNIRVVPDFNGIGRVVRGILPEQTESGR